MFPMQQTYSDCKKFFPIDFFFVEAQRAVPSGHRRARLAVPLQNEITFGNRYKFQFADKPGLFNRKPKTENRKRYYNGAAGAEAMTKSLGSPLMGRL